MFHDRLEQEIKKAARVNSSIALLFIDLDRFKEINDTLGHRVGDALLIEAAKRIRGSVRDTDTVARLGGDEFVIILVDVDKLSNVDRIGNDILVRLAQAFVLENKALYLSASIGVTLFPQDAIQMGDLLKQADQAMYRAKALGRNCLSYFTPELQTAAQDRLRILNELRGALAAGQFHIHFQPIVELATGRIRKAEALLRWSHPELGLISPVDFIPLAEETGLIVEIGDWVFREATMLLKHWQAAHGADLQITINKSPIQFRSAETGIDTWFDHLRDIGLEASGVVIEITEGLLLDSGPLVNEKLRGLRNAGIQIAIDDFGTGYSSLSYLKNFKVDYLKIDRSFTHNLKAGTNDMELCEAIIIMAHKLGMEVVAEGVETEEQRALLTAAECDYAQGYLFARAMPAEDFNTLLRANSAHQANLVREPV